MDVDGGDDEVVAEFPLYLASIGALSSHEEDIRLVEVQYPLRPAWRGYRIEDATEVLYKPNHRILRISVPEDERKDGRIHLSGSVRVPDAPLCAMCKVDGVFVLMPIDEVTALRPDIVKFVADESARLEAARIASQDADFKPKHAAGTSQGAGGAPTSEAIAPQLSTVKVELKKRENERQRSIRERSFTHFREQMEAEEAKVLRCHGLQEGCPTVINACRHLMQKFPADVAMGVPQQEYLRLVSPANQTLRSSAAAPPQQLHSKLQAEGEAPTHLDDETLAAVKRALESLFQEHSVVTMADVRIWLSNYSAAPKAQHAVRMRDDTLANLLLGGGSILCVRGRFVLKPEEEPLRQLVLDLLQARSQGIRRSDVLGEAKVRGIVVKEHEYGKVLRDLCVAKGAAWELKEGASFQGFGK